MKRMPLLPVLLLSALLPDAAVAREDVPEGKDTFRPHAELYARVAPAVVYVRSGRRSGSGFFINADGTVLTTRTAVTGSRATIQTADHRQLEATLVGEDAELELAVLKVKGDGDHPALSWGDSDKAEVGRVVYALGDSFGSLSRDDQVAISVGVLSGKYVLDESKRRDGYLGPILETSAAVNQNQDGGPLLDGQGRVLGRLTLNYDPSRFTGVAIPVSRIRPAVERIVGRTPGKTAGEKKPASEAGGEKGKEGKPACGWFGIRVREEKKGLMVDRVDAGGPGEAAGVKEGDLILKVGGLRPRTANAFRKLEKAAAPDKEVELRLQRDGEKRVLTLRVAARRTY